jgi:hypothetical protein
VKPISTWPSIRDGATRVYVAGHVSCRYSQADLTAMRQKTLELPAKTIAPAVLKNSDDQTIAGLHAVARAIQVGRLQSVDFLKWGAIASPRFFARPIMAHSLTRYAAEGAWGISPHLIPHRTLHSLSGTLSQILNIQGPNYGVGGGWDGAAEALLAGSAILADGELPGLWVVLTGFDPEVCPPPTQDPAAKAPDNTCVAVAMALTPGTTRDVSLGLTVAMDRQDGVDEAAPSLTLEGLAAALSGEAPMTEWVLPCGGWVRLEHLGAAVETCQ